MPVRTWLQELLRARHPRSRVEVIDSSQRTLSAVIEEHGWTDRFDGWETFEVQVDVTGFVLSKRQSEIFLVEIKSNPITLRDLGQLIGYCKVVNPKLGLILSPRGLSKAMALLLQIYKRYDVLEIGDARPVVVARWLEVKMDLDYGCLIPQGVNVP